MNWGPGRQNSDEVLSKILSFNLLQLAIDKYISKYSIDELPIYTMHIKIKYYNTNKG